MKILVTGASGFVGTHLVKKLFDCNHDITMLSRRPLENIIPQADFNLILTTETDWKNKVKALNPQIVIHLAAFLTSLDDETSILSLIDANISFGAMVLDTLKDTDVQIFINTGTFAEYSNGELSPAYLYAATKTAFRSIIKYYQSKYQFKTINVIPYTIYGDRDTKKKLLDIIHDSITSVEPIDMSPGEQILDFVHIDDVVSFYVNVIDNLDKLEDDYYDIHLGTGRGSTPKQVAAIVDRYIPSTRINWGGIPYRTNDTMFSVAPKSDLLKKIKWFPKISLEEGIQQYLININKNNGA